MILAKFILRSPGEHKEIAKAPIPHVPRIGEHVSINDVSRLVHDVSWDFTAMEVKILLKT